jgi:hypothetical protein
MIFKKMLGLVGVAALAAALVTVPAGAKQSAKTCKTLCASTIDSCKATKCEAITKKAKKKKCENTCKKKTINTCKKKSQGVLCSSPSAAFLD